MKRIILLLTIGLFSTYAYSQSKSSTVMIKSIETYGRFGSMKKQLNIIDEEGKITTIELAKHDAKGIPANMVTIKSAIDKYLDQGYEIISSTAVSFGDEAFAVEHTYILKKRTENN